MVENQVEQPRVSVVIPVYCHTPDHERFLAEALASVASQSYRGFEVVIVDDVSPVDIGPILASVQGLPETRILRNAANLGHARSRNAGVSAARGELTAFLDHDDSWLPDKLARQVEALDREPDAAMVFGDVEISGAHPEGLYIDQDTIPPRPSVLWVLTHKSCFISVSSVLVRKQALVDIGLFDAGYSTCDDLDAWLKILMRAPVVHLPERLAIYRLHEHNVNYGIDRVNDNRLLTRLILSYWRTAPLGERVRLLPVIARKLAGRVFFALARFRGEKEKR